MEIATFVKYLPYIFAALSVPVLAVYIYFDQRYNRWLHLPLKMTCSTMFILTGSSSYLFGSPPQAYGILLITAFIFSWIGDFLLGLYRQDTFIAGLFAFLSSHILFTTAFISFGKIMLIDALVFVVLLSAFLYSTRALKINFGKSKPIVLLYSCVIILMTTKALSTLYSGSFNLKAALAISAGALLFLISDFVLALMRFREDPKKELSVINALTYFTAQTLLALSIYLI